MMKIEGSKKSCVVGFSILNLNCCQIRREKRQRVHLAGSYSGIKATVPTHIGDTIQIPHTNALPNFLRQAPAHLIVTASVFCIWIACQFCLDERAVVVSLKKSCWLFYKPCSMHISPFQIPKCKRGTFCMNFISEHKIQYCRCAFVWQSHLLTSSCCMHESSHLHCCADWDAWIEGKYFYSCLAGNHIDVKKYSFMNSKKTENSESSTCTKTVIALYKRKPCSKIVYF